MNLMTWLADDAPASTWQARCGAAYRAWCRARRNPAILFGGAVVLALLACAAFAPALAGCDPNAQDIAQRLAPPGAAHWLGTDQLGRDLWARTVHGARPTLAIVALVSLLSAPFGMAAGICAGYFGGWVNAVLMRVTDVFMAFPRLVLALAFVALLGPGIENAVLAIAMTAWPAYARIARTETRVVRRSEYVLAARALGLPTWRVLLGQVLPMCVPSSIIRVTLDMAGIILTAAGLGFLGLGAQPPMSEWGAMVANGRQTIFDQWWVAAAPGAAILLTSLAFNLLGDGLRDLLDAKHA
ncbi:ABC transporter permease [Burkholderia multivorans]|uniref:ABC transporter permease n=1 Tax=Burkholderia ubonensis TaxID=101571 RepID=UPI000F6F65B2|nr:ABC transporter permease [Burkholderia ubonensis]AYZ66578.1 ABC transporter permease [Burkholderia multivorans]VWC00414.1 dipeptide/oligopeptide/nickel ABC transporter permease [Burkholderia ubonensis]